MKLLSKLAKILTIETTPIDLPHNGDRVVRQGKTKSGGYPLTCIENAELIAYYRYRRAMRQVPNGLFYRNGVALHAS